MLKGRGQRDDRTDSSATRVMLHLVVLAEANQLVLGEVLLRLYLLVVAM
jgi:hypothetical protein